jgi:cobalt transporter subunit CbtA
MLKTIILSAFGAGLLVGVVLTGVQALTTEPLILHGEVFEKAAEAAAPVTPAVAWTGHSHDHAAPVDASAPTTAAAEEHHHDPDAWEPADGFERTAFTLLANLLMGVAVSAMLLGVMTLRGGTIDARTGILWGVGGFFAASLLPSLGLSPELPGTVAAEITSRQIWWLSTAAASAIGLALIVFGRQWFWKALGLVIAVIPHAIGAPQPPTLDAAYPAALGAEFVVASLVASALLWSLSGVASGWLYQRLSRSG